MNTARSTILAPAIIEACRVVWPDAADVVASEPRSGRGVWRVRPVDGARAGEPPTAVLKLPPEDPVVRRFKEGLGLPGVERSVYRRLRGTAMFRVPRFYADVVLADGGRGMLIEDMGAADPDAAPDPDQALLALGEFHAQYWANEPARFEWLPREDDPRRVRALAALLSQELLDGSWLPVGIRRDSARMVRAFPRLMADLASRPSGISHGDLHRGNVVALGVHVAAVDWEACTRAASLLDVVCLGSDLGVGADHALSRFALGLESGGRSVPGGLNDDLDRCLVVHLLKRAALSGSWLGRLPDDAGLRHLVASIEQRDALRVLDRHE